MIAWNNPPDERLFHTIKEAGMLCEYAQHTRTALIQFFSS